MYAFLLSLGAAITAAGIALVASGVSLQDHSFDASNVTPGAVAIIGGCILIGLSFVVRALLRVERALNARAARSAQVGETSADASSDSTGEPRIAFPSNPKTAADSTEPAAAEQLKRHQSRPPPSGSKARPSWMRGTLRCCRRSRREPTKITVLPMPRCPTANSTAARIPRLRRGSPVGPRGDRSPRIRFSTRFGRKHRPLPMRSRLPQPPRRSDPSLRSPRPPPARAKDLLRAYQSSSPASSRAWLTPSILTVRSRPSCRAARCGLPRLPNYAAISSRTADAFRAATIAEGPSNAARRYSVSAK